MVIKLGPPAVSDPTTKILKSYAPTDSELEIYKVGIKNGLPIRIELGSSNWKPTAISTDWEPTDWWYP